MSEGAQRVIPELDSYENLINKYPAIPEIILKEIERKCNYYSKLTQEQLEKRGFEKGKKPEFLESIKESVLLIQTDYKERETEREEEKKDYELIWEKDLKNIPNIQTEWLIDGLIPPKSVGIWTGKRGSFKTFLVLCAVFCLCQAISFLGKYSTKKIRVLYLDKENGLNIIQQRVSMIKSGLKIEGDVDVAFICFSQLRLDNDYDIKEIEKLVIENDINLLVVDTYRRAIGFDENSATDVSFLFVNTLRPLVEKHNLSIVLIHHDKKGTHGDEMDDIRGSSDLTNYADFILKNERIGKRLILKQLKCRNAPEIDPIEISVETDETSFIKFNSLGNYETKSAEVKAIGVLELWISKFKIKSFKTKEAQEVAFANGIKKQIFFDALKSMQNLGLIQSHGRGVYEVIQNTL